jgi:heme/copper-type cytochrome/quinol oxidase subunit 2
MTVSPARLRPTLAGLLLALVPLAGCAGKAADGSAAVTSTSDTSTSDTPADGTLGNGTPAASGASTGPQRIEVTFAHGRASGDTGRVRVPKGTAVSLVVTSDVVDQVHLHGYDIEKEVTPGRPTTLQFDATISGVFEVELHGAGTVLLRLQVS